MRATGIVIRIDDLGRVVIPKEIRRILRIRDGDPLEIFIDNDELVLKKYSPIGELNDFAKDFAQSLHESTDCAICVCDTDTIVAVAGPSKKMFLEKRISDDIGKIIESKKTVTFPTNRRVIYNITADENFPIYTNGVIAPIISQGDAIGAVIVLSPNNSKEIGELEIKLSETAASYLGKQMEM